MAAAAADATAVRQPPLVVELSHGIVRFGRSPCELREDMQQVSVIDVGVDKASVTRHRKFRELKPNVVDLDQIWADIAEAQHASGADASDIVLVVPSRTTRKSLRAIVRHGLFAIENPVARISIIPACAAHAVGAGIVSGIIVDAGRYGTDVALAQDSMSVDVSKLSHVDLCGIDAEQAVEAMLIADLGEDFVRPADAGAVIGHFTTLASALPDPTATDDAADHRAGTGLAATVAIPPPGDMMLREVVLKASDWADRVSAAVGDVVGPHIEALADAVGAAIDRMSSLPSGDLVVNLTGGVGTLPGFNRLLAANLDEAVSSCGVHIIVCSKAFGPCNALNGACFFSQRSNWAEHLAMTAEEARRDPSSLVNKTGGYQQST